MNNHILISHINAYIWNLERHYRWSYLQGSKGDADIKNRPLVTVGEGKGEMTWESSIETCYFHLFLVLGRQNDSWFLYRRIWTHYYCILLLFIHWLLISETTNIDTGKKKKNCLQISMFWTIPPRFSSRTVEQHQGEVWLLPEPTSAACCHVSEWKSMSRHGAKHLTCGSSQCTHEMHWQKTTHCYHGHHSIR